MKRATVAIIPCIALLLDFLVFDPGARAQEPARHGRALLKEFCANCHAIGKTDSSRLREAPPLRTLGRSLDLDQFPQLLKRGISSSHPAMPEFKFSDDDAHAVSAYLHSIQQ
jgi:mono/diheme cytochrome c family protein